ncbi:hypothetical protein Psuf_094190 [Phytohabitans suffuscus]|uniref:Uncharacterized protein n=1 Tax=Phytohabitans suffuscus TaxID=624315 RepID=A0A6F8Z1A2_9ACTN|nr:hypothetical protein Psuf_094190 [Phytohabitans suffuscus]
MPLRHLPHNNRHGRDIYASLDNPHPSTPTRSDHVVRRQADPHHRRVPRAEERKRRGSTPCTDRPRPDAERRPTIDHVTSGSANPRHTTTEASAPRTVSDAAQDSTR